MPSSRDLVYDSLLKRTPDGSIVSFLASSLGVPRRDELTLSLEPDVEFTDGAVFDSKAVKANLEHFQEFPSPSGPLLRYVESVETPDDADRGAAAVGPGPFAPLIARGPAGDDGKPRKPGHKEVETEPVGTGRDLGRRSNGQGFGVRLRAQGRLLGGGASLQRDGFLIRPMRQHA